MWSTLKTLESIITRHSDVGEKTSSKTKGKKQEKNGHQVRKLRCELVLTLDCPMIMCFFQWNTSTGIQRQVHQDVGVLFRLLCCWIQNSYTRKLSGMNIAAAFSWDFYCEARAFSASCLTFHDFSNLKLPKSSNCCRSNVLFLPDSVQSTWKCRGIWWSLQGCIFCLLIRTFFASTTIFGSPSEVSGGVFTLSNFLCHILDILLHFISTLFKFPVIYETVRVKEDDWLFCGFISIDSSWRLSMCISASVSRFRSIKSNWQ